MAEFVKYTTKQGDRLDTISTMAYGTPHAVKVIVDANPALPILNKYDGGIELAIPVIDDVQFSDNTENLPAWKK